MLVGGWGVEACQEISSDPCDHSELGFTFLVISGRLSLAITHPVPHAKGLRFILRGMRSRLSEHAQPGPVLLLEIGATAIPGPFHKSLK
jgi:hypothetical protein